MINVDKIHNALLDILEEFKRVCEEEGLRWFLDSGSLLGAIRDGKLIEWDDDIDVIMPREDYNKLLKLHYKFNNPFKLQTPHTEKYCDISIRVINKNITCISKYDYDIPGSHCLFIDVFPLDSYSDDQKTMELEADFLKFVKTFYCMRFQSYTNYNKYLNILSNQKMFDFVNEAMTKITEENKDSEYVAHVLCYSATKYRFVKFHRSAFDTYHLGKLNGHDVRIPVGYKEVLEGWYGKDWKTPRRDDSGHSFLDEKIYDDVHQDYYYMNMPKEEFLKLFEK